MAASKRPAKGGRAKPATERLTPVNLAVNLALLVVAAPALFVLGVMVMQGQFGGTGENQHLFLGSVLMLVGVFLVLLGGLRVWEHAKARRRFRELLGGEQKSAVVRNLDELTALARSMGPRYRRQLDARLGELGIKR